MRSIIKAPELFICEQYEPIVQKLTLNTLLVRGECDYSYEKDAS